VTIGRWGQAGCGKVRGPGPAADGADAGANASEVDADRAEVGADGGEVDADGADTDGEDGEAQPDDCGAFRDGADAGAVATAALVDGVEVDPDGKTWRRTARGWLRIGNSGGGRPEGGVRSAVMRIGVDLKWTRAILERAGIRMLRPRITPERTRTRPGKA